MWHLSINKIILDYYAFKKLKQNTIIPLGWFACVYYYKI